jgi:hypothetical protein
VPGPALTSAALYSCSPRHRMDPSCHAGARLQPDIARRARRARRGRLRGCQATAAGRTLGVMRFVITDDHAPGVFMRQEVIGSWC